MVVGVTLAPAFKRGLAAKQTGGEKTTPQSRCSRDSSPDKGSLWGCRRKGERYMKATGIVRRVDDLGRIVNPKEIRRTLRIREGDPFTYNIDAVRLILLGDE